MYKRTWIMATLVTLSLTSVVRGTDGREDSNPERTTEAMQANARLVARVLDIHSVGRFLAHGNAKVVKLFKKSEKMKKGLIPGRVDAGASDSSAAPHSAASARESAGQWRGPDHSKM